MKKFLTLLTIALSLVLINHSCKPDSQKCVDLGLPSGLKWATCNVGANSPEEYGSYLTFNEACDTTCDGLRMPTMDELEELIKQCSRTWTEQNGVNGYKFTGPNGNSIFLPAAGFRNGSSLSAVGIAGHYWSSTQSRPLFDDSLFDDPLFDGMGMAECVTFISVGLTRSHFIKDEDGLSVRLVSE